MRDEFLITRQGKQYVLYAGLLEEAHGRGLRSLKTKLVQVPDKENGNVAIVHATAKMHHIEKESRAGSNIPEHKEFDGIGDASPENVGRNIAPHIIRMAETRAKARALRDAVNIGVTSLEELSEQAPEDNAPRRGGGAQNTGPSETRTQARTQTQARPPEGEPKPEGDATEPAVNLPNGKRVTESQLEQLEALLQKQPAAREGDANKQVTSRVATVISSAADVLSKSGASAMEDTLGHPIEELDRATAAEWIATFEARVERLLARLRGEE